MRQLAATVLVLQLGSFGAHFGMFEHRVCAEHGEMVHGDDHSESTPDAARIAAPSSAHDHDVCAVWQSLERTDADADDGIDAPSANFSDTLVAEAALPARPTQWRLAPKTSPPLS